MDTTLSGRTILVVEDECLIALDIVATFERAGAAVAVAHSLAEARPLVECNGVSAAVIDFDLGDGDAQELCARLSQKHVPFVLHSGYSPTHLPAPAAVIPKPANADTLVAAVTQVLGRS